MGVLTHSQRLQEDFLDWMYDSIQEILFCLCRKWWRNQWTESIEESKTLKDDSMQGSGIRNHPSCRKWHSILVSCHVDHKVPYLPRFKPLEALFKTKSTALRTPNSIHFNEWADALATELWYEDRVPGSWKWIWGYSKKKEKRKNVRIYNEKY